MTVCSSDWTHLEIDAVSNYTDDIEVGKRRPKKDGKRTYYVSKVKLTIDSKVRDYLMKLFEHLDSSCDEDACKFCKEYKND